ncbi:MAG: trypsin-like peptidase domain-containing protein [Actinomycetota bacterium]|nr:trypsin-like peptidase domain-containing protein [Actinomycetota bacterium]
MPVSAFQSPVTEPDTPQALPGRHREKRSNAGILLTAGALLLTFGVLIGLLLGSPAASNPAPVTPPAATSLAPADIAAAAAMVSPAVVQLESEGGLGSGVIYDSEGLILTAAHVVDGVNQVNVRLADGRLLEGEVIGRHELTDIAVIGIPGVGLPVASLGYGTTAHVGETAIALGSPFGLNQTVTAGIVSATGRAINGIPMVQTDAAINPGNSGGPLINGAGKVIGINDVIFTQGGGNDGIGFAVSIDVAIVVADQLVAGGDVQLAALGVATIPDVSGQGGAIVREVVRGSAADLADLQVGDRIVAVDGQSVFDPAQLFTAVVSQRPGADASIDFTRDGRLMTANVTLQGISP